MNEDMKQVLEELEKDLFDEDLLEDMPQSLKQDSISDEELAALLAGGDMEQDPEEPEEDLLVEDLLEDLPQGLEQDSIPDEELDALLADFLAESDEDVQIAGEEAEPAFEDPDRPEFPEDPAVYNNYSNDYGNDSEEIKKAKAAATKEDKWQIALMGVACGLCVAIIGVMIYWLETFLK